MRRKKDRISLNTLSLTALAGIIQSRLFQRRLFQPCLILIISTLIFSGSVSADPPYTSITAGRSHACAIDQNASLTCEAFAAFSRLLPTDDSTGFKEVVAGDTHTCAIKLDEVVVCWGDNSFGQLDIPPLSLPLRDIDAGQNHTCAIDATGIVQCWGLADNQRLELPYVGNSFSAISVRNAYGCVVDDNLNASCATVLDSLNNIQPPVELGNVVHIEVFSDEQDRINIACAIDVDGNLECWGDTGSVAVNLPVFTDGPYRDVAIGESVTCALRARGSLECHAHSASVNQRVLDNMPTTSDFIELEAGYRRLFCTVDSAGDVGCWGTATAGFPFDTDKTIEAPALMVSIYSATTVELLWQDDGSFKPFGSLYEIRRNGEVLATTENRSSYIDATLQPGVEYEYQLVLILGDERSTPSNTVIVDASAAINPGPAAGYTPPSRSQAPVGLRAEVYWENTVELFWQRDPTGVRGYEVRRNGSYVGFTDGTSFLDTVADGDKPDYDVIAVDGEGDILGFSSLEVIIGVDECR